MNDPRDRWFEQNPQPCLQRNFHQTGFFINKNPTSQRLFGSFSAGSALVAALFVSSGLATAQQTQNAPSPSVEDVRLQVSQLAGMVAREQVELESSRQQIELMRKQIAALQGQLAGNGQAGPAEREPEEEVARLNAGLDSLRERQDLQQSQIATHEQTKVESESKFPVKLTGLILLNTFANTSAVDVIQSPAISTGEGGTTGLSIRQTVLGLDARGPHVFGSNSTADARLDFFGGGNQASYAQLGGTVRLRTAHAQLAWDRTRAFAALDRPIVNPGAPTSLTAVAQPPLAWSGNLWNWVPQLGVEHTLRWNSSTRISTQAAIADIPDGYTSPAVTYTGSVPSLGELSRWPASQARIGYAHGDELTGPRLGVGGYFSPHTANNQIHFDAWAATVDYRVPLFAHLEASGSFYRGAALGGLGAGAYKDYVYQAYDQGYYFQPLDDVGGWAQLKARATERLEFNAAYGIDNAFAHEIRPYLTNATASYLSLARNATFYTNVIYSPTAYTLFSLEYRRIDSSYAIGPHSVANIVGVAAGYRF